MIKGGLYGIGVYGTQYLIGGWLGTFMGSLSLIGVVAVGYTLIRYTKIDRNV